MASRRETGSPEEKIGRMIKMKAKKLIACPEYRNDPANEIEHDLQVVWFKIRARYDCERGDIVKFADVALNNHIRNMIAARRTQKRGGRKAPTADGSEPHHTEARESEIDLDDLADEFDPDEAARRIDVRRAVLKLSPELRRVAESLAEGGVTEIARSLKMSRMTVYKRIEEIRRLFGAWGLDDYFNRR